MNSLHEQQIGDMLWKLKPHISQKIWGSERWLFSTHPHGHATVVNSPYKNWTLAEALEEDYRKKSRKNAQISPTIKPPRLTIPPVLIKIIETQQDLSVQVHPDDGYAGLHENSRGKSECWLFMEHQPHATVISGLTPALRHPPQNTPPQSDTPHNAPPHNAALHKNNDIRKLFLHGDRKTIEANLRRLKVEKGAVLYIPAGTIHAIGGGITLLEVQQSSDITYRLYDYGRNRETHLEQSLAVLKRDATGTYYPPRSAEIIATPYFTLQHHTLEKNQKIPLVFSSPQTEQVTILVILTGSLAFRTKALPETKPLSAESAPSGASEFAGSSGLIGNEASNKTAERPSTATLHTVNPNILIASSEDCLYAPSGGEFLVENLAETASYVKIEAFLHPNALIQGGTNIPIP